MGGLPLPLAVELRDRLALRRGIETGTYRGGGARLLAGTFCEVVTIELSSELHAEAVVALADLPNVQVRQGDSGLVLTEVAAADGPALYFLDGHWSGGSTAGEGAECPVLAELEALRGGHRDDCILVDDARLFAAPPPQPHDPAQWPSLVELFDVLRDIRPGHHVTMLADLVIAVPSRARDVVDRFGQRLTTGEREASPVAAEPRRRFFSRRA